MGEVGFRKILLYRFAITSLLLDLHADSGFGICAGSMECKVANASGVWGAYKTHWLSVNGDQMQR